MRPIPSFEELMAEVVSHLEPLLERVYDAGLEKGREQGRCEVRAKLQGFLSTDGADRDTVPETDRSAKPLINETTRQNSADEVQPKNNARTAPGTVKPTILRMLRADTIGMGFTERDMAAHTGFKLNSVRGTLWTLKNEGAAIRNNGRWYSSDHIEVSSVEPEDAPLETSHVTPTEPAKGEGAAQSPVEPVPGGGT